MGVLAVATKSRPQHDSPKNDAGHAGRKHNILLNIVVYAVYSSSSNNRRERAPIMQSESQMIRTQENLSNCSESPQAHRMRLADAAVNNELTAVDRLRARVDLLNSYISDELIPPDEQTTFRARVSALVDGSDHIMQTHRKLRQLENQIYIPMREGRHAL